MQTRSAVLEPDAKSAIYAAPTTARDIRKLLRAWLRPTDAPAPTIPFGVRADLRLPHGVSEAQLFDFVSSVLVADAPVEEMRRYCTNDFRRFVHTYGLVADERGMCLELGSNSYFTTMLLNQFTELKLVLANFFAPEFPRQVVQEVAYRDPV